ncbi:MAG: hypothetical protein V3W06_09145 [Acidimicrobiia bacterium]
MQVLAHHREAETVAGDALGFTEWTALDVTAGVVVAAHGHAAVVTALSPVAVVWNG